MLFCVHRFSPRVFLCNLTVAGVSNGMDHGND